MAKTLNLIASNTKDFSITQGSTYERTFTHTGDASTATPRGQIRSALPAQGGELLAEFTFTLPIVYTALTNTSAIVAKLPATVTQDIPPTEFQGEGTATQENCYIYDIEIEFPSGVVEKVISLSLAQVKPEVTVSY